MCEVIIGRPGGVVERYTIHQNGCRHYDREVDHKTPITPNVRDSIAYKEVTISDCPLGCKIYQHEVTGERVLAHNSAYGSHGN